MNGMALDDYPFLNEPHVTLIALRSAVTAPTRIDDCQQRILMDLQRIGEEAPPDLIALRSRIAEAFRNLLFAGLVDLNDDHRFVATPRGVQALYDYPKGIDHSVLEKYPEFRSYISRSSARPWREDDGFQVMEPTPDYEKGYAAYGRGLEFTDNPNEFDTVAHLEWENGWWSACKEATEGR